VADEDTRRAELAELRTLLAAYQEANPEPDSGLWLMFDSLRQREQALVAELDELSLSELAITMEGPVVEGRSLRVAALINVLGAFQRTVASVGQALVGVVTVKGQIPHHIREATALRLVGTAEASFGVRLRGPLVADQLSLLGEARREESVFGRSVEKVLGVIEAVSREEPESQIRESVAPLGIRAVHRFVELADALNTSAIEQSAFVWSRGEDGERAAVRVTRLTAERLEEILSRAEASQRNVQYRGRLGGASTIRDRFELQTEEGDVIAGRVEENVVSRLREFFDQVCTVTLQVTIEKSTIDEEESASYVLVDIED
jgi:hypothetical protein